MNIFTTNKIFKNSIIAFNCSVFIRSDVIEILLYLELFYILIRMYLYEIIKTFIMQKNFIILIIQS